MKTTIITSLVALMFLIGTSAAQARPHSHHVHRHAHKIYSHRVIVKPAPRAVVVKSFAKTRISALPAGHLRIVYAGNTYYHHDGIYYIRDGVDYVVVTPSQGLRDVVIVKRV